MIIREIDLFEGMSEEVEQELAKVMEGESYNSGEVIIKEGAAADNFYILQTGALNVKMAGAKQTTHVAIRPGEAVGWSSLAGRDTYTASVECAEPSKLVKINKDKLDQVLRRYPGAGLLFYKRLAGLVGDRLIKCYQVMVKLQEERV
ncbi:MAG: cyclic nucleotide-binding domain-containing protein [Proteobacteria bacterium]|nr:cyclic nucleotide-binding domain-containing protein [Pseudomonadota bacterium]